MNSVIRNNIIRILVLFFLQVLVLKGIDLSIGTFQYFHLLVYPMIIMLLPFSMPKTYILLLAFVLGICVDVFYDSLGIHASSCLILAYVRPLILGLIEPRGGYTYDVPGLGNTEITWIATYVALMLFVFLISYFSIEAFSYVYFVRIILSTICSFIISFLFILVYQIIFRTTE